MFVAQMQCTEQPAFTETNKMSDKSMTRIATCHQMEDQYQGNYALATLTNAHFNNRSHDVTNISISVDK